MSSDLIVNSRQASADYGKYIPQSIRALRAAEVLKIDCLPNDSAPVFSKLASSGPERETKIAFHRKEQKRCCTENTTPGERLARLQDPPRGHVLARTAPGVARCKEHPERAVIFGLSHGISGRRCGA
jgi:hypothetical protein